LGDRFHGKGFTTKEQRNKDFVPSICLLLNRRSRGR
jgi:hypothetical protein